MPKKIIADAGHFTGCVNGGKQGYKEYEFALWASRETKRYMESTYVDVEVIISRDEKTNPSLYERGKLVTKHKAVGFMSWHTNASGSAAKGPQIYYHMDDKRGKELALLVLNNFLNYTGYKATKWTKILSDSSIYKNGFGVLSPSAPYAPSLLIETLFHTNLEDEKLLLNMEFRAKTVKAVCDAYAQYLGISKKAVGQKAPEVKPSPVVTPPVVKKIIGEVETLTSVNVRTKPSLDSVVIRTLKAGSKMPIVSKIGSDWFETIWEGKTAYITSIDKYVKYTLKCLGTLVTLAGVNLRDMPSMTEGTVIKVMPKGSSLKVIRQFDGLWFEVEYDGKKAYMTTLSKFVKLIKS